MICVCYTIIIKTKITKSGSMYVNISDYLVYAVRNTNQLRGQPKIITFRDFKRFNETDLLNDITHVPWSIIECCDSVDTAWTVFRDLFLSVCDVHAKT